MKANHAIGLAVLAGFGLGAVAVQSLHAQAKPPVYMISQYDIIDKAAFMEWAKISTSLMSKSGGKFLARGAKPVAIMGNKPPQRVTIVSFESMDKLQAWFNSAEHKKLDALRDKAAKFRTVAVTGVAK